METTTNHQVIFKVTLGVLIGVFSLMGYLFLGAQNETLELQKSLTTKVEQLSYTELKLDSIAKALDDKIRQVRQLGGNVTELQKIKTQLENDKKKLKYDVNFSAQNYQFKIKEYENYLVAKEDDIRRVKAVNGLLVNRAKTLEAEKLVVIQENAGLKYEKEALSQTVADFSAQNDDLQRKVTLASALKAINVQVAAVSSGGKERTGGSYKASRIDLLKISFIIPTNPLALKNNKDIFVRIMDSNGGVLSENGIGGVVYFEGREIGYSIRQTVLFDSNDQEVDILYRKNTSYKPGKYAIELYAEGFKIGTGSFEVK